MIGCDYCGEWFHGSCVGVTEVESSCISTYKCPTCTAKCVAVPFYEEGKIYKPCVLYMYITTVLNHQQLHPRMKNCVTPV